LILDTFEHLVEGGDAPVKALLARVEGLTLLVTSRCSLDIPGEHLYFVMPLPVPGAGEPQGTQTPPDAAGDSALAALMRYGSVALFVTRAQQPRRDFQLTARNAKAVAELCRRVDGIPLALELLAARAGEIAPARMLADLRPLL